MSQTPNYSGCVEDVRAQGGFLYLASPYTNYHGGGPWGRELAHSAAAQLAGEMQDRGFKVYSPVAALHHVGEGIGFGALDHADWMSACMIFIHRASCLLVVMMDGWGVSQGVGLEIEFFETAGKPVFFLDPHTRELTRRVGR